VTDYSTAELKALFADAVGEAHLTEVAKKLVPGDGSPDYAISADRFLTFLYAARSGSTYAGQLIANHRAFGKVSDWFNAKRLAAVREENGLANDYQVVQHILDRNSRAAFGQKCNLFTLGASILLGLMERILSRTEFVILRRRDETAQAVSLHRAKLSRQFHSIQDAAHPVTIDDFDYEAIAGHKRVIARVYALHEAFLKALGRPVVTYFYEDMIANPMAFQRSIFDRLGLYSADCRKTETAVSKIGDEINAVWIERFDAIERAGGPS
jgi:LPS sulfotransferase NodH